MKSRPALGSGSALSGRRERTDRNVISVRIEPRDERACPLKRPVEIIDTEEQQEGRSFEVRKTASEEAIYLRWCGIDLLNSHGLIGR
jgi:hypothetical protein